VFPLRALIVDDEPVARKVLREELESLQFDVIDEAGDGWLAFEKIQANKPDAVFLDIEIPGMSGFELLDRLNGGFIPAVVMVTAYDQHAMRAFEAGAIDYLLKPVSGARLAQALERVQFLARNPVRAAERVATLQQLAPGSKPRKIVGKLGEELFLLSPEEILAFQADGELVWIITAKQRFLATENLRRIEERLKNTNFRRIHRKALVNVEQIRKMSLITSQRWLVTLNNGQEFVVSKRRTRNVRDILNW
jgi:DNA-binding LytR/AlgR family response regulator